MSEKTLLDLPISFLYTWGYLLTPTTRVATLKLLVQHTVVIYSMVVSILQYFYTKGNIFDIVDNMEATLSFIQVSGKVVFVIYFKNEILRLIQMQKKFWSADKCTNATKREVASIKNVVHFIQMFFIYGSFCHICCLAIPIGAATHHFGIGIWRIPDHETWFWFSFAVNTVVCLVSTGVVTPVDTLFMGFCYEVKIQFKILGDHMKRVSVVDVTSEDDLMELKKEIKVNVEYHNFLLSFVEDLRNCYSVVLLVQYMTSAAVICSELFMTFESPGLSKKIEHFVLGSFFTIQLSLFCISPAFMVDEISGFGNQVYNSNWYGKHFLSLKKSIQLMIQRSQQDFRFTLAAGIVDINCESLVTVLRTSFSICTLLRNLKK